MAVKLADAFIQITASMEGTQKQIARELSGLGKVGQDAGKDIGKAMSSEVEKAGKSFEKSGKAAGSGYGSQFAKEAQSSLGGLGDRLVSGIGKGMLAGAAVAGTAVAGTLGAAIGKGFSRLTNIDQAEAKLRGLGNSAEDVAAIMESANAAVTGTAFGLDEAATTAASAVAAGIEPGKDLQRTLTLMGDAATIAGTEMSTMGSIVNKVATSDMMQMDVANQLMDAGIPIMQMVAEEMGVTADEARKMASDGEVSFEIFQNALEKGLGGAALESGNTFKGALANAGAAMGRFGASLAAPVFDNAPVVFGAIGDAFGLLQEKVGPLAEDFGEWLAPKVEDFAANLGPWLVSTVENIADAIGDMSRWLKDNAVWLKPVVAGLGALAGVITTAAVAISAWNKVMAVYKTVTAIATGQTLLFNNALKTNAIILVVSALAALVSGLVYFFTQTETGQKAWQSFTDALAAGWDWFTEKLGAGWSWIRDNVFDPFMSFLTDTVRPIWDMVWGGIQSAWDTFTGALQSAWENIIRPVFDAIWKVAQVTIGVIGTVILAPLLLAWEALSWGISTYWNTVIKPAWDALSSAATWMWENVLQPVFGWIKTGWEFLGTAIQAGYQNIILPAWTALQSAAQFMWNSVLLPVFGWIQARWQALSDGVKLAYDTIIKPAWDAMGNALSALWNNVVSPVIGFIQDRWEVMGDGLHTVWTWIDTNVLGSFRTALDGLKTFFGSIVDGIRDVWDKLRGYLAKPINFMINTVYNDGILRAWNVIAGILPGLEEGSKLTAIPEYAVGGAIRGPGSGTSDDILAKLSNGEHVWTAREVAEAGGQGHVYAMREMVKSGRPFSFDGTGGIVPLPKRPDNHAGDLAGAAPDLVPRFATGGEVRPLWELQLERGHEFAKAQHGKPYQWGGPGGPGQSFDCSGYMASIAAAIQGQNVWQRYWATMAFPPGAQGFQRGLGPGFSVGIWNGGPYGGHTAGTLGPAGPYAATNVESGGSPSMVKYGIGAAGADDPQFRQHWHLPIGADGGFVSGGEGGISPEAMQDAISKKISGAIDKIMGPIADRLPSGPPSWQDIPRGVYESGRDGLSDKAAEMIQGLGDKLGTVYSAVTEMGDLVRDAASGAWNWARRAVGVFDTGGMLQSGNMAVNLSGQPERVLPPNLTRSFDQFLVQVPGLTENLRLASEAMAQAASDMAPEARAIGEDYLATQASSVLDIVGLGGLVPLGMRAGEVAWDAYQASPYEVGVNGQTVVVEIDASEEDERVRMLRKMEKEIDWLKVHANRKAPAAMVTRGGAM